MEMRDLKRNGSDGASRSVYDAVSAGNGDGAHRPCDAAGERLLPAQDPDHKKDLCGREEGAEKYTENSAACRIRRELTERVFGPVQLWMILVFIFLLVAAVVVISLAVCSAIHEDADEKFDPSTFRVPLFFNGSFRLPRLVFTEELLTPSSNGSREVAAALQHKLADLYTSSPALGRYFRRAEINALRNGSVVAEYRLTFVVPEEQRDELGKFTLSREVVYNVFRQFLYDQDPDGSESTYVDPLSLRMA